MELTIQLAIIFVGKQVLNDFSELGIPYVILHNDAWLTYDDFVFFVDMLRKLSRQF